MIEPELDSLKSIIEKCRKRLLDLKAKNDKLKKKLHQEEQKKIEAIREIDKLKEEIKKRF